MQKRTMLAVVYVIFMATTACADQYRFAAIEGGIGQQVGHIVLKEVYRRLGKDMGVSYVPARRAEQQAVSGQKDGELQRIWEYGEQKPEMVRVPTWFYAMETVAVARKGSAVSVKRQGDLARYRIARKRGVKHTDVMSEGVDASQIVDVSDITDGITMVRHGRVDLVLMSRDDYLCEMRRTKATDVVCLPDTLGVFPIYHYLHPKHAPLAKRVNEMLLQMQETGELAALVQAARAEVYARYCRQ